MSGPYPYAGVIIIDPATNAPGPGASVLLYDPLDTAYATPQSITDAYGNSLGTTLTAGAGGWSGMFIHATLPILNAKAGDPGDLTKPPFELVSGSGIIENSAAAVVSASAAQVAAETAAAAAALSAAGATAPVDTTMAATVTTTTTETHAALVALIGETAGTDADAVHNTGDEAIDGEKTFNDPPVVPDGSFTVAKIANLQTLLNEKALAADLAATNVTVGQKVTATLYNGIDIKVTPLGGGAYLTGGSLEIQLTT